MFILLLKIMKIYVYLRSKHKEKDKYQIKEKSIREERLIDDMENMHSHSGLKITRNKNEF